MEYAAYALIALALVVGLWKKMMDLDLDEDDEDVLPRKKKSSRRKASTKRAGVESARREGNDDVTELQPYEKRLMGAPIFDNRNDSGGGGTPPAF